MKPELHLSSKKDNAQHDSDDASDASAESNQSENKSPSIVITMIAPKIPEQTGTVDWRMIERVSNAQCFLTVVNTLCLVLSLSYTGFGMVRFTSTAWVMYLLGTAMVGIRAGQFRQYGHLIAFTGMVCFQTVVYMSSFCWLVYAIYALDFHFFLRSATHNTSVPDFGLILVITEITTLMGTVFTGVYGLATCCRCFGRFLEHVDRLVLESRKQELDVLEQQMNAAETNEPQNNNMKSH